MNYFEHKQYSAQEIRQGIWHIHDATQNNIAGAHEDGSFNNTSSVYVIEDESQVLVIDLGNPYEDNHLREIVNMIAKDRGIQVAITHHHFDHIGALSQFQDCPIYVPKNDPINDVKHQVIIDEGDTIQLDHLCFEVLDAKGHTTGSLAFYERNQGILATGDAFGSSYVWLLFMPDVLNVYQQTLDKILRQLNHAQNILFLCGHRYQQQITTVKGIHQLSPKNPNMDIQYLKDMRVLVDQILDGTAKSHEFQAFGRQDLKAYTYGCAEIDTYLPGHSPIILEEEK